MGKKSKPDSPDYKGAAEATAASNAESIRNQTWANRANQYGPEGALEWTANQTIDPSTGEPVTQWTQNTKLSPELQAIYDQQLKVQGDRYNVAGVAGDRLMDQYGEAMDWGGMQGWGDVSDPRYTQASAGIGNPNAYRQRGEDASYESQMRRINPQFAEQKRAMELQMRNQGLTPQDEAWQSQMQGISEGFNDASTGARLAAAEQGRAESALNWGQQMGQNQNLFNQRLSSNAQNFGMDNTQFNQANQLRGQQFQEALTKRGFDLNELQALINGQQVNMPQFGGYSQAGNAGGTDYTGAAQDQGNFDQSASQGFWGGVGDLAGAGLNAYGMRGG